MRSKARGASGRSRTMASELTQRDGGGVAGLASGAGRLAGQRVCVDGTVLVGWVADDPEVAPRVAPVFEMADRRELRLVASVLALMDVLVAPYRLGRWRFAERCAAALAASPGLELIDVGRAVVREAGRLRATSSVPTPAAVHLGTALSSGCGYFLTADREMPETPGLRMLRVAEL